MAGSNTAQTLTINGAGFGPGDWVRAWPSNGNPFAATVVSVSATQIQVSINVGTAANTWTFWVYNSAGVASNSAALTVTGGGASGLNITSLTPNPMTGSNTSQTLTINGTGFASGDWVRAYPANGTPFAAQVLSVSATQIQISLNTGTAANTWSITVYDSTNNASNTMTLSVQ
jgi:hypothetical protein